MSDRIVAGIVRFVKGFVAGGIGSVLAVTSLGVTIADASDLKKLGVVLLGAFFTGGLMAVQKMYSWVE